MRATAPEQVSVVENTSANIVDVQIGFTNGLLTRSNALGLSRRSAHQAYGEDRE
jgi:hypothetical protein